MRPSARAVLDRLPPYGTVGVGSLPGADPALAVRHVMASYDVPFCPQLPSLDGNMIDQWLGVPPGRCGWSPERDHSQGRAWDSFIAAVAVSPPTYGVVKLQVTGPVTLCWALEERDNEPAAEFAGDVAKWLAHNVRTQVTALGERGLDCLLMVDEPALDLVRAHPGLVDAWKPLREAGAAWGLHICCSPPWGLAQAASPDVLNIDLAHHPFDGESAACVARLLCAGATMAWGVTPTSGRGGAGVAMRLLDSAIGQVVASGVDPNQVAQQSLLTASCGTGANTPDEEAAVVAVLQSVATTTRLRPSTPLPVGRSAARR